MSNTNTVPVNDLINSDEWAYILSILSLNNCPYFQYQTFKTDSKIAHPRFANYLPRLIVVGTTGVFSSFKNYSQEYMLLENLLFSYSGSYLLLRPSMIYGSRKDKNLHKVFKFIRNYNFYPIFGSGNNLLHPVHYKDLVNMCTCPCLNQTVMELIICLAYTLLRIPPLFVYVFVTLRKSPHCPYPN